MAGNDDRFTGGDALTPGTLEHDVHQAMMSNELSGGRGADRMSSAVLTESRPSLRLPWPAGDNDVEQ